MKNSEYCPVAVTLEMIGGKYKSLILWHLADGTQRFSQLRKKIPKATPKMLTQQLRELESQKLIHREIYPVIPPRVEYSLTDLGKSLMPVLVAMRDWGAKFLLSNELYSNCIMMQNTPDTKENNITEKKETTI